MTRHGWRSEGRVRGAVVVVLTMLVVCVAPARALAWDSPLEPVTPGTDNTQTHGLGLIVEGGPTLSASAIGDIVADAADLPASVDLSPWAMPVGDQGQVGSCAAWATDYSAMGYWMNKLGISGGPLAPMFTYSQYTATYTGGRDEGSTLDYHPSVAKATGVDNLAVYPQGNYNYSAQPTAAQRANAAQWKVTSFAYLPVVQSATSTVTQ